LERENPATRARMSINCALSSLSVLALAWPSLAGKASASVCQGSLLQPCAAWNRLTRAMRDYRFTGFLRDRDFVDTLRLPFESPKAKSKALLSRILNRSYNGEISVAQDDISHVLAPRVSHRRVTVLVRIIPTIRSK
jgi:hypothetical protein